MPLPAHTERHTKERGNNLRWRTPSADNEDGAAYGELSLHHDREDKQLVAYLHVVRVQDRVIRQRFGRNEPGGRIARRSIARYSAKALAAFEQDTLATLSRLWDAGHADVRAVLPEADLLQDA